MGGGGQWGMWETYFGYHGESQQIAHATKAGYKDLSAVALPEDGRKQIHDGGDLSFHLHKLGAAESRRRSSFS